MLSHIIILRCQERIQQSKRRCCLKKFRQSIYAAVKESFNIEADLFIDKNNVNRSSRKYNAGVPTSNDNVRCGCFQLIDLFEDRNITHKWIADD